VVIYFYTKLLQIITQNNKEETRGVWGWQVFEPPVYCKWLLT